MLKDHNTVTPVRLEPAALRSRVKHSTTEPLRSLQLYAAVKQRDTIWLPTAAFLGTIRQISTCESQSLYFPACMKLNQKGGMILYLCNVLWSSTKWWHIRPRGYKPWVHSQTKNKAKTIGCLQTRVHKQPIIALYCTQVLKPQGLVVFPCNVLWKSAKVQSYNTWLEINGSLVRASTKALSCVLEQDTLSSAQYWFSSGNFRHYWNNVNWDIKFRYKQNNQKVLY